MLDISLMADDKDPKDPKSPKPRDKRWDNLKPFKKGEVRNPTGANGARWMKMVRKFFKQKITVKGEKPEDDPVEMERFWMVCEAAFRTALRGNPASQKLIIEQLAGKAKETIEVSNVGDAPSVVMWLPNNGRGPAPATGDEPPDDEEDAGLQVEDGEESDDETSSEVSSETPSESESGVDAGPGPASTPDT
jgi:hypothetical protein